MDEKMLENLRIVADLIAKQLPKGIFLNVGGETPNTMTIGWGGYSFYWGRPVFTAVVRPQRFTYPILERERAFTLSIPDGNQVEALRKAGTLSGRDGDKFKAIGLLTQPGRSVDAPIVLGCPWHVECRVLATTQMTLAKTDPRVVSAHYPANDFHTFFLGEIVECYQLD